MDDRADGFDHAITDEEFAAHRPEPAAVCGEVITLAPMETPSCPRCARCSAFLAAHESLRDLEQRTASHRYRWLGRFLYCGTLALVVLSPCARARNDRLHLADGNPQR